MRSDEVLIRPVLSEKSTSLRDVVKKKQGAVKGDTLNKFVFIVHKDANKIMVKQAIQELYDVKPEKVNIMNVKGKLKRVRYQYGLTASYKKAIVTLKKGDKISAFEGA